MPEIYETMIDDLPKNPKFAPQHQQSVPEQSVPEQSVPGPQQKLYQVENFKHKSEPFFEKFKHIFNKENIQALLIISILYILLTSDFYMNMLGNCLSFVEITENKFNIAGVLITAVIMGFLYMIINTFV